MNCLRILALVAIASFPIIAHTGNGTLLAVLEEPQCKDGSGTHVRALYVKSNGEWHSLNTANASAGHIAHFAERDRSFRVSVTDGRMLHE